MPCPFRSVVHDTAPKNLLRFDRIEITSATTGEKSVFVLRGEHYNYCWFLSFANISTENAAYAVIDWSATLDAPNGLMSEAATNLKYETVRLVPKGLRVPEHYTFWYSLWSNEAVERLGKGLLLIFCTAASELLIIHNE